MNNIASAESSFIPRSTDYRLDSLKSTWVINTRQLLQVGLRRLRANYLRPVAEVSLEVCVTAAVVVNCVPFDDRTIVNAHLACTLAVRATFNKLVLYGQRCLVFLLSLTFTALSVWVITLPSTDKLIRRLLSNQKVWVGAKLVYFFGEDLCKHILFLFYFHISYWWLPGWWSLLFTILLVCGIEQELYQLVACVQLDCRVEVLLHLPIFVDDPFAEVPRDFQHLVRVSFGY